MKSQKNVKVLDLPIIGSVILSTSRTFLGITLGLIASAILVAITGVNPLIAYASLLKGAFGSEQAIMNVLVRSSPLLLGGIAVSLGIKAGVWNIGIEGYMYVGAIGATMVGILDLGLPPIVHILISVVVAAIFAGLWGAIPGYLRAYKGVNEVVATIMLNYIAIYLTSWVVSGFPFIAEPNAIYPMSKIFQPSAFLPILVPGTSLHMGPFIGIILCLAFSFILKYTPFGFRTKMLGSNPFAARYSGTNSSKQIMIIIIIGAVIGGFSGAIEIMGLKHRLFMGFVTGVGYESVAVALLAAGNPIGVIFSALFFASLKAGGATMSIETGVASSLTSIIVAMCMLFVIGVGVVDSKRIKKIVDTSKYDEEDENVLSIEGKEEK